jgi:tripartite-type tricarboxylate transporter receptor subunit TctC
VQRINREMDAVIKEPAWQQRVAQFAYQPIDGAGTPASIAQFIASERELWDRVSRTIDLQPQ